MDKKLYKELRKMREEMEKKFSKYSQLSGFLNDYKRFFREEKSREALKEIEKYVEDLRTQICDERDEVRRKRRDLEKTCEHAVLIKWNTDYGYTCFACGRSFNTNDEKVQDAELLIDGLKKIDYSEVMKGLCDELVDNNQDIVDGVIEKMREINNNKVLIRRR